jgi:nucleotide-binding universal stress UspA family protein
MRIALNRDRIDAARAQARRAARRTAAIGYRSIVVPLLGHGETEHALDLACRLAARRGAKVLLVAPIVAPHALPLDADFGPETAELRKWLTHAEAIAKAHGVATKTRLVPTRATALGRELAEVARDHRAELVVVGAPVQSRRGFSEAFPREIRSILQDAPCRVLIVSGRAARRGGEEEEPALHRILVPMKVGPIGEEMVATAVKLAEDAGAGVQALHVMKVPLDQHLDSALSEPEEQAAASIAEAARLAGRAGVPIEGETVRGRSIGEAIVLAAADSNTDLIVLGSSPRWRRQSRFFSPTVDYVLRHASAEVLVVAFPQGVFDDEV